MDTFDEKKNKQDGNVGNIGDVLKHVLLLRLLREACRYPATLYAETHAYEPVPALAAKDWPQLVADLPQQSPCVIDYRRLQEPWVREGRYLASTGIAGAVLNPPRSAFVLCESDRRARERLRLYLPAANVLDDADRLPAALDQAPRLAAVVALIDPFSLNAEQIGRWLESIDAVGRDSPFVAALVFTYGKQPDWKSFEVGALRLAATIARYPFYLALYTRIASEVEQVLLLSDVAQLGWALVGEPPGASGGEPRPPTLPPPSPPPGGPTPPSPPGGPTPFAAFLASVPAEGSVRRRYKLVVETLAARRIALAMSVFWDITGTPRNSWDDLTACGADDRAQAHVLGKGNRPTNPGGKRSPAVLAEIQGLCDEGRRATTREELERLWD